MPSADSERTEMNSSHKIVRSVTEAVRRGRTGQTVHKIVQSAAVRVSLSFEQLKSVLIREIKFKKLI